MMCLPQPGRGPATVSIVLIAVVAATLGYWLGRPAPALRAATLYQSAQPLVEFELSGRDGPFTNADWRDQWDLVFFGFTHCPDICPNTLALLRGVRQRLKQPPRVTLISVDPERDSPARLAQYVAHFDPSFRAATGSREQLDRLTQQFHITYQVGSHAPGALDYDVDHYAGVFLVDPQAQVHALFSAPLDAEAMVADLRTLVR